MFKRKQPTREVLGLKLKHAAIALLERGPDVDGWPAIEEVEDIVSLAYDQWRYVKESE